MQFHWTHVATAATAAASSVARGRLGSTAARARLSNKPRADRAPGKEGNSVAPLQYECHWRKQTTTNSASRQYFTPFRPSMADAMWSQDKTLLRHLRSFAMGKIVFGFACRAETQDRSQTTAQAHPRVCPSPPQQVMFWLFPAVQN